VIYLKQGHVGPKVVALQVLLNRKLAAGPALVVDGQFGPKTRRAVIALQAAERLESQNGVVWKETWGRLTAGTRLTVIDAVDVTVPGETKVDDVTSAGGRPVATGGMCHGAEDALWRIVRQAGTPGSLVLLRFQGHGRPGVMGLAVGKGIPPDAQGRKTSLRHERSHLGPESLPFLTGSLAALRPCFAPCGSVELHACRTAGDIAGRKLVIDLTAQLGVPVTAGIRTQYSQGSGLATFVFEGPVFTAFPDGGTLRSWARGVAEREGAEAVCR
jgi:hypothetical protein